MQEQPESSPEARILRERPFAGILALDRVERVPSDFAHSGTAFFVRDRAGRRFKLRACSHPLRAAALARYLRLLPEVFPRLVAREGRFLLLQALEDYRLVTRAELLGRSRELGRIAARVHVRSEPALARRPGLRTLMAARFAAGFLRDVWLLRRRGTIPPASGRGALRKFRTHLGRFGLPIALELDDLHKGNVMLRESDGDLRYVDEEGVGLRPKGAGLASLMKTVSSRRHWQRFRDGYAELADASFFTDAYTEYLLLLDAVRRVARKVRTQIREEKLPREIAELREMADRDELALDWRFPKGP
jgi:hypothetical protein